MAVLDLESLQPQLVPYVHRMWHTDMACESYQVKAQKDMSKNSPILSCTIVHFGDIPAECIVRVVGHDETIFFERPSQVAPRAPALQKYFRHRVTGCLTQDRNENNRQAQKRVSRTSA